MELTRDQIAAVKEGRPVLLASSTIGEDVVLVRASVYREMEESLAEAREKDGWADRARAAAAHWAEENPY